MMLATQPLCPSPEVFALGFNHMAVVLLVGVLVFALVGKLIAECAWYCVMLYLRRRPSWRRFDRSMRRLFA
jgi:hypothetical protein